MFNIQQLVTRSSSSVPSPIPPRSAPAPAAPAAQTRRLRRFPATSTAAPPRRSNPRRPHWSFTGRAAADRRRPTCPTYVWTSVREQRHPAVTTTTTKTTLDGCRRQSSLSTSTSTNNPITTSERPISTTESVHHLDPSASHLPPTITT